MVNNTDKFYTYIMLGIAQEEGLFDLYDDNKLKKWNRSELLIDEFIKSEYNDGWKGYDDDNMVLFAKSKNDITYELWDKRTDKLVETYNRFLIDDVILKVINDCNLDTKFRKLLNKFSYRENRNQVIERFTRMLAVYGFYFTIKEK